MVLEAGGGGRRVVGWGGRELGEDEQWNAVVVGTITCLCFYFFFSFIFRFSCKKGKKNCRGVLYVFHEFYQKNTAENLRTAKELLGTEMKIEGL